MDRLYPHLFQPIQVGGLRLKNRIFSAPQGLHAMQNRETYPTQAVITNMTNKARGGAGLVTCHTVSTASRQDGSGADTDYDIFDAVSREYLAQMAEEIHFYGAGASMELNFLSGHEGYDVTGDLTGTDGSRTQEISAARLQDLAENYATQAYICKYLGYDMVMLHMGYQFSLMARFLSPASNTRTDEFGGSAENRVRFPLMVCDAIKSACGKDYPIEIRMSGAESIPGGMVLEDAIAYAKAFVGHADLLQIHGPDGSASHCMGFQPDHPFLDWAAEVKQAAPGILIDAIGGFQDPEEMEAVLAQGKADAVCMGRGLIADPEMPNKALEGRRSEIVPCVKCMRCHDTSCIERVVYRCAVNPAIGMEHRLGRLVEPVKQKKRVAVVGGGPAGMQAALTALDRGHAVTLFEMTDRLGGQLVFADHVDFKRALRRYKDSLADRVQASEIELRLNTKAGPEELRGFDAVILALGAEPCAPDLPGVNQPNVLPAPAVYGREQSLGRRVVIIGGGQIGCETAMHLARKGLEVTLLSRQTKFAASASSSYRYALLSNLYRQPGVTLIPGARAQSLTEGVTYCDRFGYPRQLQADTIILASGMVSRSAGELETVVPRTIVVGDCARVGSLEDATRTGWAAALIL